MRTITRGFRGRRINVRFVAASDRRADLLEGPSRAKTKRRRALFDDLVGADEKCRRNINAERLGGLEVDHKLELGLAAKRIPCSN